MLLHAYATGFALGFSLILAIGAQKGAIFGHPISKRLKSC